MIRLIKKIFWNLLLLAIVIYGLYYFKVWPFKENVASTEYLKSKYCKADDPISTATCDCIVERVSFDIDRRFSVDERKELESNRAKMAYALQKSLKSIQPEAMKCLKDQGQEAAWDAFIHDLVSLDNALLGKATDLLEKGAEKAKEKIEQTKTDKADIDKKY
jgi:hypothetical protein